MPKQTTLSDPAHAALVASRHTADEVPRECKFPKRTDWVRLATLRPKAEGRNGGKPPARY